VPLKQIRKSDHCVVWVIKSTLRCLRMWLVPTV